MTDTSWPRDHASAAERVRAHLPGGSRARLRTLGAGDFCLAFRRHEQVVRVARHAGAADALRREACILARIAGALPLRVPEPAFHRPAVACAFSVHRRVAGSVLTRARWERLPAEERERVARELGGFLGALHALPAEHGLECGAPPLDLASFALRLRSAPEALARWLPPEVAARLGEALEAWSSSRAPEPVLLHRDIAPGHVLFDARRGGLSGIIDFGDLAVGDPARDFIYVYEDFGPELLAAVLRGYPREDAVALLPRIRAWYLLEAVAWTVERAERGETDDVEEGAAEIAAELGFPSRRV